MIIKMEQEPSYIRDLTEGETNVPKLPQLPPQKWPRNDTFMKSPLMTYQLEEVRRREARDSL